MTDLTSHRLTLIYLFIYNLFLDYMHSHAVTYNLKYSLATITVTLQLNTVYLNTQQQHTLFAFPITNGIAKV